jgi:RHS repeat-associated protein
LSVALGRYTTADGSYYRPWLDMQRSDGNSRLPLYDMTGSTRRLVDAAGTVTGVYSCDAFGKGGLVSGSPANPYRFGGAWGYITDPSGMQQLGARHYWPEVGRFVQQDPVGEGMNWYAYVGGNPARYVDPSGEVSIRGIGRAIGKVACAVGRGIKRVAAAIWTGVNTAVSPAPIPPETGTALAEGGRSIAHVYCDQLALRLAEMEGGLGGRCNAQGDPECQRLRSLYRRRCQRSSSAQAGGLGEAYR